MVGDSAGEVGRDIAVEQQLLELAHARALQNNPELRVARQGTPRPVAQVRRGAQRPLRIHEHDVAVHLDEGARALQPADEQVGAHLASRQSVPGAQRVGGLHGPHHHGAAVEVHQPTGLVVLARVGEDDDVEGVAVQHGVADALHDGLADLVALPVAKGDEDLVLDVHAVLGAHDAVVQLVVLVDARGERRRRRRVDAPMVPHTEAVHGRRAGHYDAHLVPEVVQPVLAQPPRALRVDVAPRHHHALAVHAQILLVVVAVLGVAREVARQPVGAQTADDAAHVDLVWCVLGEHVRGALLAVVDDGVHEDVDAHAAGDALVDEGEEGGGGAVVGERLVEVAEEGGVKDGSARGAHQLHDGRATRGEIGEELTTTTTHGL